MTDEQPTGGVAPNGQINITSFFGQTNCTAFFSLFRSSAGSNATRYGDSPGSNPGRARIYATVRNDPGAHRVSFGLGVVLSNSPHPNSSEERAVAELHHYTPYGASWPVKG
jgi:hypothetical protein